MGTINHLYDPGQDVYTITPCEDTTNKSAVVNGTVIRVRAEVTTAGTELRYDIRLLGNSGTTEFEEADVFPDLPTAIAEYELRLT